MSLTVPQILATLRLKRVTGERRTGLFDLDSHNATGPSEAASNEPFPTRVAERRAKGPQRPRVVGPAYERYVDPGTGEVLLRRKRP